MLEVNIQIQKSESGYSAYSPEISDRQIQGESLDGVVNEIKEIVRVYLEKIVNKLLNQRENHC